MRAKLTTEAFIKRSIEKHGNRYDYSATEYVNADHKINICCKVHGTFYQRAADHMRGFGCSLCNERQTETAESFITKAKSIHGQKYGYENVLYKNTTTKVAITCSIHGDFEQVAKDHLAGYGCPDCGGTKRVTKERFIKRAIATHGNKYQYDNVEMKSMAVNVEIVCPHHGSFSQRPADHIRGSGCPVCSNKKRGTYTVAYLKNDPDRARTPAFLYLIKIDDSYCKLGITTKKYIKQRFPSTKFEIIESLPLTLEQAISSETKLLAKYESKRYKIHNLRKTRTKGWTECFPLELLPALKEDIDRIKINTVANT